LENQQHINKYTANGIVKLALIFGALAVIIGAFGAHAVAERVSEKSLAAYKTGVSYQFYHTILLLVIGLNASKFKARQIIISAWLLSIGIICFSGSLYGLTTRAITGWDFLSILGPITPIGGIFLILGWLMLIFSIKK